MVRRSFELLAAGALLAGLACAATADTAPTTVQVHGYLQNRAYLAPAANLELVTERVSLSALANLPNESIAYAEVYYHPWAPSNGLYLESGYYDTGIGDGRARVGKGRRLAFGITPTYPNRKTSNYGIVSEAFTQDRIVGTQYVYKKDALDTAIDLQMGYRLGYRQIGSIPGDSTRNTVNSVPHLSFRDGNSGGGAPASQSTLPAVSARVGGNWQQLGLRAGISAYYSELEPGDFIALTSGAGATNLLTPINPLTGLTPTSVLVPGGTSKKQQVWGPDFMYRTKNNLVLQGEWYDASVSSLDYNGWELLGGLDAPKGWKFFVRYGRQNMDTTPTDNPLSWDVNQWQISAVQPIRKGLWLQYEYEINGEKTNTGADVKNNLFFAELFTGF